MNEEKYFSADGFSNEYAEFDLDDFDLNNEDELSSLYNYVNGLQQKLRIVFSSMHLQEKSKQDEKKRYREFKFGVERKLLKIFQNEARHSDWLKLGHIFNDSDSVTDYKLSFLCYQKAAELSNNDSYSSFILGDCYENGFGTEKNLEKAFEYYSIAAKSDEPYFINKLAECYKNGIGTPIDEKKVLELYEKAKQVGEYQLIQLDKKKFESFKKKLTETTEVTTKNAKSWIAFGDCYKNGRGTKENLEKAKECYKKVLAFYEETNTSAKNYRIVLNRLEEIKNGKLPKKEQIAIFEKELTEVTEDNVNNWISLGDLYRKLKRKNYKRAYECYKNVYNFYEQTKEYDENYRRVLKRLLICFDKGIGSESEEEINAIREKLIDYETDLLHEKGIDLSKKLDMSQCEKKMHEFLKQLQY